MPRRELSGGVVGNPGSLSPAARAVTLRESDQCASTPGASRWWLYEGPKFAGCGRYRRAGITLRLVESDADYVAWRRVRIAVVPAERCGTVEELRRDASASRLLLLAMRDGEVAGSGLADRSETEGGGFVEPQVVPGFRRQGIGGVLLRALAGHVWRLGMLSGQGQRGGSGVAGVRAAVWVR
jgi:GNAT superfamily N-acetyltransferase